MTTPHDAFSLTRLFITPSAAPPSPKLTQDWVGGVMTQWDAVSRNNTVQVGPVTYRNLPVVSPNGLTTGTVLLAKAPAGYIVMGMLATSASVTVIDPIRYRVLASDINLPSTALIDAGTLNFLVNANTQYGLDGVLSYNSTTVCDIKFAFTGPPNMAVKWSMFGLNNATTNSILSTTVTSYGDAATQTIQGAGFPVQCRPGGWFATTDTPGLLQLRVALDSGSTAGSLQQGSWLRISELGSGDAQTTYVKIYQATGSRSYDNTGAFIGSPDGDNNMYTWTLSGRTHNSEDHMWTFNGAQMRSDLTGATILSAQMFLYCFAASSTPADLTWKWSTTSSIAATFPANGFGGADIKNLWPVNGWGGFDISSQMTNIIDNNANSVLGGSYNIIDSSSGFRGYGYSASYRPYIQVTYAI